PREEALRADGDAGSGWSAHSLSSDSAELRDVFLRLPDPTWPSPAVPDAALHLRHVDCAALHAEIKSIARAYQNLGINAHVVREDRVGSGAATSELPNSVFVRDVFWMTPEGAVV